MEKPSEDGVLGQDESGNGNQQESVKMEVESEDKQANNSKEEQQNVEAEVENQDAQSPTQSETEEVEDNACEDEADINKSGENSEDDPDEANEDTPIDRDEQNDETIGNGETEEDMKHPYQDLLDNYTVREEDLKPIKKIKIVPLHKAQHLLVSTKASLMEMVEQVSTFEKQVGIITKYNTHNYISRLCILQISTRRFDYIIDSLKLEKHLHLLSNIFGDPKIVKVMHGAERIMKRLQLDHKLFFVNIFDTYEALRKLGRQNASLRSYVQKRFRVPPMNESVANKLFKWHLRPLPENYKNLILIDGHFLLPTYFNLRNELIEKKLLQPFMLELNKQCKRLFKETNTLEGMIHDIPYLTASQAHAMHAIEDWRHNYGYKKRKNVNLVLDWPSFRRLLKKMPVKTSEIAKMCAPTMIAPNINEIRKIIIEANNVIGPVNSKDGETIGTKLIGVMKGKQVNSNGAKSPQKQGIVKAKKQFQQKVGPKRRFAIRNQVMNSAETLRNARLYGNYGRRYADRSGPASISAGYRSANYGRDMGARVWDRPFDDQQNYWSEPTQSAFESWSVPRNSGRLNFSPPRNNRFDDIDFNDGRQDDYISYNNGYSGNQWGGNIMDRQSGGNAYGNYNPRRFSRKGFY